VVEGKGIPVAFVLALLVGSSLVWVQNVVASSSSDNDDEDDDNNNSNDENQDEVEGESSAPATDSVPPAEEFVPETCFTLTIPECNEVNAKFATQQTFSPRCQVTLADGQLITIYKEPTKTCSTSQEELGGMTYQRYQEEEYQKYQNSINESVQKFGDMFNPPTLSERLEELQESIDNLR
jgi:hypothetical protein